MDAMYLVGVVVIVVNFVSAFSIVHQILLTYRRKSAAGLSPVAWTMGTTNAFVGLLYSYLIGNFAFLLANLAWFTVNSTMLALMLYFRTMAKTNQGVG